MSVGDSYTESANPRIVGSGESIDDYKHFHEFEAEFAKASTVVKGSCAEPIYI